MAGTYWVKARNAAKIFEERVRFVDENTTFKVENYKKDRWIELTRRPDGVFILKEVGYTNEVYELDEKDVRKISGKIFDREFPRSNQLRFHFVKK
ncbi:MAG: hypothetical protein M1496_07815 [Candidatus Thermoplasmatota archaeon]|jgi:hypothetical protein|nr:hypothetical protein [Candidatus Thermoplasmatota archaeon]